MGQSEAFLVSAIISLFVMFAYPYFFGKRYQSDTAKIFSGCGVGLLFMNLMHFFSSGPIVSGKDGSAVGLLVTLWLTIGVFLFMTWAAALSEIFLRRKMDKIKKLKKH